MENNESNKDRSWKWIRINPDSLDAKVKEKILKGLKRFSQGDYWSRVCKVANLLGKLDQYCNSFSCKIKGVSNVDVMINLFKKLLKENKIKITPDEEWIYIDLDVLNKEIRIINLWSYDGGKYKRNERQRNINDDMVYETNKNGMIEISNHYNQWREVATQTDIQNILNALTRHHFFKSGKEWDIHDEDIAFFMLITQSDGEFLLKSDKPWGNARVLKCYDNFRWFRDMKENWTWQIILIRKKR